MSKNHYIIPIFVPHEGCPHNCVFCNQTKITGEEEKVDANFVKNTIDEYLKTIDKNSATIEVSFFGGTFTAIPIEKQKELLAVAKIYKEDGKINKIRLSTRPDYIDRDILNNLKDYSVDIIELGIQSLDEEVLLKSGRGHNEEDVIKASNMIKDYGFTLGHQIMLGLPGDTFEKDIDTTKKIIGMKPKLCRIYPSLVIKDTPMEWMYNKGIYKPYTLEEAVNISKIVYSMLISEDINVIRIGLQPTENINKGGDVVAGPFHPAFRELVESSLWNDIIYDSIKEFSTKITIYISDRDVSKLYANKKIYFNRMKESIKSEELCIRIDKKQPRGNVTIDINGNIRKLSFYDVIKNKGKEGNLFLP
ncbi:elongator complex protein 3 [Clostridium amazonitimonense]|uniref:elongator complex protein 3 n=1 Tax=Clostridium amazonitimonense TaxID=1499689 RepID=UPI000509E7CD|nr:radical SAM protein [Clostridium amazonitimonense]